MKKTYMAPATNIKRIEIPTIICTSTMTGFSLDCEEETEDNYVRRNGPWGNLWDEE